MTAKQRAAHIERLTTNCDCWKGDEGKETLEAMSDEQLSAIAQGTEAVAVANEARQGFIDGDTGSEYRFNAEASQWEKTAPAKNAKYEPEEDDDDDDEEEKMPLRKRSKKAMKAMMNNQSSDIDEEDTELALNLSLPKKKPTINEWLASAPPEGKEAFEYIKKLQRSNKAKVVEFLVANAVANGSVAEDEQEAFAKELMQDDIKQLLKMTKVATRNQEQQNPKEDPFGMSLWQLGNGGYQNEYGLTENEQMEVLDINKARESYDHRLAHNQAAQTA